MMFSTLKAKLAGMKTATKVMAGTAIAAAALMAAPGAQAQRVSFGVSVGTPVYVAPAPPAVYGQNYFYNGAYYRNYNDAWRAQDAWGRDHQFNRDRDNDRRDTGRGRQFDHDRNARFDRR
jgi:hypothetical protein